MRINNDVFFTIYTHVTPVLQLYSMEVLYLNLWHANFIFDFKAHLNYRLNKTVTVLFSHNG